MPSRSSCTSVRPTSSPASSPRSRSITAATAAGGSSFRRPFGASGNQTFVRPRSLHSTAHRPMAVSNAAKPAVECDERPPIGAADRGSLVTVNACAGLAAAAGAAAGLADVAAAGRTHLHTAGQAQRRVGGGALLLLDQLGRRVNLDRRRLGRGLLDGVLERNTVAQRLRVDVLRGRCRRSGAVRPCIKLLGHGRRPLLGGEDAELSTLLVRQVVER